MEDRYLIYGYILNSWARDFVKNAFVKVVHNSVKLSRRYNLDINWPLESHRLKNGEIYFEVVQSMYFSEYIDVYGNSWIEDHPLICLVDENARVISDSLWINEHHDQQEIIIAMPFHLLAYGNHGLFYYKSPQLLPDFICTSIGTENL